MSILDNPAEEQAFADRKRLRNAKREYEQRLAEWHKLPRLKRLLTRKPRYKP